MAERADMAKQRTETSAFGVSKREAHNAAPFYARQLYGQPEGEPGAALPAASVTQPPAPSAAAWANRVYCQSSTHMTQTPAASVGLAFTSPPYNVGKAYDLDLSLADYLTLMQDVAREVYRVLVPGGRYVVNIANLGRKPYIPLHAHFYQALMAVGFLPMGEIIWQKSRGANGNCAWGSWQSARAPRLRDIHEYLLVFAKEHYSRPERGASDIARDEFLAATLSLWEIPPESATRVGHPAPFPVALAERVIQLYSYVGDVVLDPFAGSGTTCVAAALHERQWLGYDISPEYCALAEQRIAGALAKVQGEQA
jgi:DNA modification methylase